ncbi:hypothetical protein AZE42_10136, partial [Rhizopogon vesiculosus]
MPVYDILGPRR